MLPRAIRSHVILAVTFALLLTLALPDLVRAQSNASVRVSPGNHTLNPSAAIADMIITSRAEWQQTTLTVQQGKQFTLSYISGMWTVDTSNFPFVGPDGYSSNIDTQIDPACKVDSSLPFATLLGQIGNGRVFKVGKGSTFTADQNGTLSLRINDRAVCFADNDGSITMRGTLKGPISSKPLGGTWISPRDKFVVTGNTLHFAAQAYGGAGVKEVKFTVWWSAIGRNPWHVACSVPSVNLKKPNTYECDWNLTDKSKKALLNGPFKVSFDVYDNAGNKILSPNGVRQVTIQRGVSFRAPFNKGVTFSIKTGYHNHSENGCQIGTAPDHCHNQLFGIDLVPDQQSDTTILAPAAGIVVGVPSDPNQFGCMQIMLYDGLTFNICHFSVANVSRGQQVNQGDILGTRSSTHVHLSIDNRNKGKPYVPVPFNGAHTFEGISLNPNSNGKGETVTSAGQTFKVKQDEWKGWKGTSSN